MIIDIIEMEYLLGRPYRLVANDGKVLEYMLYQGHYEHEGKKHHRFCHLMTTNSVDELVKDGWTTISKTTELGKPNHDVGWYQTHISDEMIQNRIVCLTPVEK